MIRWHILSSVGVIGIASGLATTPVYASEKDSETQDIAIEARGDFAGFRIEQRSTTIDVPLAVIPTAQNGADGFVASIAAPTPEIISRDDVGLDGSVDVDNTQPSVVQLFIQDNVGGGIFFNCTGTVINPRTVLTAAHCLNSASSESYGLPGVADTSVLISSGVDSSVRFFDYLDNGTGYNEGGVATSTDVVIHPSANLDDGGLPFPWADVAFVAVDAPITDVPAMPILLSPLTELTHVIQVGYGGFGTAETGDIGIGFLRRVGENMLGAVASPADLLDTIFSDFAPTAINFGVESQVVYFTDFDNPDRTPEEQAGCELTGQGISCVDLAAVQAIDFFDGDALPNEVGTAGGDSGSPLIADQLNGPPVVTGVLSGGFDFFGAGNTYSDISFYAPLFPFFEFITENTPYKYVSAKRGNGDWSDPNHWTQDLDPGFLIDDGSGTLVNGIPGGSEPGVYETGPKLGTILGNDISGNAGDITPILPPEGTLNFGANIPESSVLLGPGSTGFVPNNTDGTPGASFENPAQYFDVLLTNRGRTRVDMDVEIDKLAIDNGRATFVLPRRYEFTSLIGVEQFAGRARINGTLNAGIYALFGGELSGRGTINTDVLFNVNGLIAPNGIDRIGTLTVNGDYVQTSGGFLLSEFERDRRTVATDLLDISGFAGLAGTLVLVNERGRPRFGSTFTVLSAGEIVGDFDQTVLIARSPILTAESRVESNEVIVEIGARRLGSMLGTNSGLSSLGNALDTLRFSGRFDQYSSIFNVIDSASVDTLGASLASLTPVSAFNQSAIANGFSQRFTGQIAQRTLALRGANGAAAGFSAAGNASFAMGGTSPAENGQLGFFSTVSGSFLDARSVDRSSGTNAFEEAAFTQAGELTVGADLRVSENFSLGVAMTNIRNSNNTAGAFRAREDESHAAAVYAAYKAGNGFADMYFGFSDQEYGTQRASQGDFRSSFSEAIGNSDGEQSFAGIRLGYAFDIAKGFEVGPVVSMDYVRNEIGGYSEFGAGQLGLNVQSRDFTSLGTKVGLMSSLDLDIGRIGKVTAFGSVAYARELADTTDVVTASFFGAPDAAFQISNPLDPEWVSINAGAQMALSNRINAALSITSDLGRGVLTNNQGRFLLSWKF